MTSKTESVPSLDRALEEYDSKFRYVLLASERAEQLVRGARAKLDLPAKHTRVAMEEVRRGLVDWGYGPAPEEEPEAEGAGEEEMEEVEA